MDAQLNECMALYRCMSSHVHVCGAYICLPEASVLNSLSMCDESSGWEKSSALHGLSRPSHKLNSKNAIDLSGSQFKFCSGPNSLSYLCGFVFPCLHLPMCLSLYLLLYFLLIFWIDITQNVRERERCSKHVRQIKKERASPTHTSFILIRSLCPRKGLLFTCLP